MEEIKKGGPLQGLKVLDLTRVLSGPFATKWLATMGADVIKIENPKEPDVTRNYVPKVKGHSAYFPTVNHNKKCITLNLKAEEGKDLFRRMVRDADVVIENFRPGVMNKLGLGYEALAEINPGIIYASISGFGTYGPYAQRPGYDVTAQAFSGIMYLTGEAGGPPSRIGSSYGDTTAGVNAVLAILAALYCRQQTGRGQMVETSLVESLISLSTQDYIRYFAAGGVPVRMGNIYKTWTPYGCYKARDGWYNVGVGGVKHWAAFTRVIGHPELENDPRFVDHPARVQHRAELDAFINAWAADKTVKEICDLFVEAGVPCAPVNSIVELSRDPHFAGVREMFPKLEQEGVGELQITNIPIRFSESGLAPFQSAGEPGRDNEDVYGALGLGAEEIRDLKDRGVI